MRSNNVVRIAMAVGIAALCIGVAAPAATACPPGGSDVATASAAEQMLPSVAEAQGFFDRFIANRLDWLAAMSAKVAADPDLSAAKKAKIEAAIQQEQAALTELKAQIDSATSVSEVWADVHASRATSPPFWWAWWWFRPGLHRGGRAVGGRGHHATRHGDEQ